MERQPMHHKGNQPVPQKPGKSRGQVVRGGTSAEYNKVTVRGSQEESWSGVVQSSADLPDTAPYDLPPTDKKATYH